MILPEILRNIIRISIKPLEWWSQEAEELLLMTAAHESQMGKYTQQIDGPALGIYQMEIKTLYDNYMNYLNYRSGTSKLIVDITGVNKPSQGHLQYNPVYSTIHARIKYLRVKEAIPTDPWLMAEYAKDHFNTHLGAATPEDYYDAYRTLVLK